MNITTGFGQTTISKSDPFDDPSVLDEKERSAIRDVSAVVKEVRVWDRLAGELAVSKPIAQTKPDAVYRTQLSVRDFSSYVPNPALGKVQGKWTPVEVRRYGRLLLGFRIEGEKTAENYYYVRYDKAGSSAVRIDAFYVAVQNRDIKEVR